MERFSIEYWDFPDDYEGKVRVAFLASKDNRGNRPAMLWLHGFSDYFFQSHVAEFFNCNGFDFFALDLRKCGRSWQVHQHRNYCQCLCEYYPELTRAITVISQSSGQGVILLGHSTGGLLVCRYLMDGDARESVTRVILNSPFLELNMPYYERILSVMVAKVASTVRPFSSISAYLSPWYTRSLHRNWGGEWEFDLQMKPEYGLPVYMAWLCAIVREQRTVRKACKITQPLLLLHSERSIIPRKLNESCFSADTVLNVGHMKTIVSHIARHATIVSIPNALHDITLSRKDVREFAFLTMLNWLKQPAV